MPNPIGASFFRNMANIRLPSKAQTNNFVSLTLACLSGIIIFTNKVTSNNRYKLALGAISLGMIAAMRTLLSPSTPPRLDPPRIPNHKGEIAPGTSQPLRNLHTALTANNPRNNPINLSIDGRGENTYYPMSVIVKTMPGSDWTSRKDHYLEFGEAGVNFLTIHNEGYEDGYDEMKFVSAAEYKMPKVQLQSTITITEDAAPLEVEKLAGLKNHFPGNFLIRTIIIKQQQTRKLNESDCEMTIQRTIQADKFQKTDLLEKNVPIKSLFERPIQFTPLRMDIPNEPPPHFILSLLEDANRGKYPFVSICEKGINYECVGPIPYEAMRHNCKHAYLRINTETGDTQLYSSEEPQTPHGELLAKLPRNTQVIQTWCCKHTEEDLIIVTRTTPLEHFGQRHLLNSM